MKGDLAPRIVAASAMLLVSCGPAPAAKLKVGDDGAELELSHQGLRAYVTGGAYRGWAAEPAVRDSTQNSPHGKVRVFFNKAAYDALKANEPSLPVGAMIVKDLLQPDGTTLSGYAAMVKSAESSWTWWEAFTKNLDSAAYFGVDIGTCKGCHSQAGSIDQVRTPAP